MRLRYSIARLNERLPIGYKVAAVFAVTGLVALNLTTAAAPAVSSEAEAGNLSNASGVSVGTDPLASGGTFVKFGNLNMPPPPPPPSGSSLLKPVMSFTKQANLRYSTASPRLLLDLYLPDHNEVKPLIIYIHGGFWSAGSKDECLPAKDLGNRTFMHRGYAVACINYRLTDEAIYPAQIEDVKASVRWLRANATTYKLYSDKISVWGSSAGGHLTALAGTTGGVAAYDRGENMQHSSTVQAIVDYFGPADLTADLSGVDPKGISAMLKLLGGDGPDLDARKRAASPTTYITADDPPFYIVHGDRDRLVPLNQSQILHQRLQQAGVGTQLTVIPGAGHGGLQFVEPARLDAISRFLDMNLR